MVVVANKYPLIDLRNLKSNKVLKESNVLLGELKLLGWVVLKSDENLNDDLNEPLAKLCAIEKGYWERLVNPDEQRIISFPSDFNGIRIEKMLMFHFIILKISSSMTFLL